MIGSCAYPLTRIATGSAMALALSGTLALPNNCSTNVLVFDQTASPD